MLPRPMPTTARVSTRDIVLGTYTRDELERIAREVVQRRRQASVPAYSRQRTGNLIFLLPLIYYLFFIIK